jgi:hypothetical protein
VLMRFMKIADRWLLIRDTEGAILP